METLWQATEIWGSTLKQTIGHKDTCTRPPGPNCVARWPWWYSAAVRDNVIRSLFLSFPRSLSLSVNLLPLTRPVCGVDMWWMDVCWCTEESIWACVSQRLYRMLCRYILLLRFITLNRRAWNLSAVQSSHNLLQHFSCLLPLGLRGASLVFVWTVGSLVVTMLHNWQMINE